MNFEERAAAELLAAFALHQKGHLSEAERRYQSILSYRPQDFQALHHLGVLRCQQSRSREGAALILAALKIDPRSFDALFNLAIAWRSLGRNADAVEAYDRALALQPAHGPAHFQRDFLLVKLGRLQDALAGLDQLLLLDPRHYDGRLARGVVLGQLERNAEALAEFEAVLRSAPDNIRAMRYRGVALDRLGRDAEAIDAYDAVLALQPQDAEIWNSRANAMNKLGRFQDALQSSSRALQLKPNYADASATQGVSLSGLRQDEEAVAAFERALVQNPRNAVALYNQGNALGRLQRHDDAIASYDKALDINPDYAEALYNRGNLLRVTDRSDKAIVSYERAIALRPDHPYAFGNMAHCRLSICDWDVLPGLVEELERRIEIGRSVISPFVAVALSDDPSLHFECASRFVRERVTDQVLPAIDVAGYQADRLRIAYLSADFRSHPVGSLIPELIERHDRSRFEIIGISIGPDDASLLRARLAGAFDRFLDLRSAGDLEIAKLIRDIGIHIAVDLNGHTEHARPQILGYRPAAIQMQYLGYPGSSGADYIDYIIADPVVLPPEHERYYSEKIIRLPETYFVNDTKKAISENVPTRSEAGLPEDGIVLCCFNASYKITSQIFEIWMRLLKAVDNSVLWLLQSTDASAEKLKHEATRRGVKSERIVFARKVPELSDHLARQSLADLFLDTLPFNAHTTASEALWVGLPVVTCQGASFAGRVCASLLHAVGLPELVTKDLDAYEALALSLARDPAMCLALRRKLNERKASSALFDIAGRCRELEQSYLAAWQLRRSGRPSQNIDVSSRRSIER